MKKFKFTYTEMWAKGIEIEAETEEEAYDKANKMAGEGKFEIEKIGDNFVEWTVEH